MRPVFKVRVAIVSPHAGSSYLEELSCVPLFEPARQGGVLYRLSFFNLVSAHMSGFSAGGGRRGAARVCGSGRAQTSGASSDPGRWSCRAAPSGGGIRGSPGRPAFFLDAIAEAWETVNRGDRSSLQPRAAIASASQTLQRSAVAAVDAILPLTGARAIYSDKPIRRCFRDLHAASQHIFYGSDGPTHIGQVALARTPDFASILTASLCLGVLTGQVVPEAVGEGGLWCVPSE